GLTGLRGALIQGKDLSFGIGVGDRHCGVLLLPALAKRHESHALLTSHGPCLMRISVTIYANSSPDDLGDARRERQRLQSQAFDKIQGLGSCRTSGSSADSHAAGPPALQPARVAYRYPGHATCDGPTPSGQTASKSSLHQCGNKLTVFPHLIPPD